MFKIGIRIIEIYNDKVTLESIFFTFPTQRYDDPHKTVCVQLTFLFTISKKIQIYITKIFAILPLPPFQQQQPIQNTFINPKKHEPHLQDVQNSNKES